MGYFENAEPIDNVNPDGNILKAYLEELFWSLPIELARSKIMKLVGEVAELRYDNYYIGWFVYLSDFCARLSWN